MPIKLGVIALAANCCRLPCASNLGHNERKLLGNRYWEAASIGKPGGCESSDELRPRPDSCTF
jgi:hypothetical protein